MLLLILFGDPMVFNGEVKIFVPADVKLLQVSFQFIGSRAALAIGRKYTKSC
jgi:hypothetical protein